MSPICATSSESDEDNDLQLTPHNRGRQLSQGKEYIELRPPDSVRLLTSSESDEDNDLQLTPHNRGRQLSQGKEYIELRPPDFDC